MAKEVKTLSPEDVDAQIVKNEIQKFTTQESDVDAMREKYMVLTITDIKDVNTINQVHEARMLVKKNRIEIEKTTKAINKRISGIKEKINAHSEFLVNRILPIEEHLQTQEDWVDAEKERIKEEKARARQELIETRSGALAELGMMYSGSAFIYGSYVLTNKELEEKDEEDFEKFMKVVGIQRKMDLDKEIEEQKKKIEEEERIAEQKRQEEERLEQERIRLKKLADEQAERDRLFKEQQEKFERDKREFEEAKLKAAEIERQKNTFEWYYHSESDTYICLSEYERFKEPVNPEIAYCDPIGLPAIPGEERLQGEPPQRVLDHHRKKSIEAQDKLRDAQEDREQEIRQEEYDEAAKKSVLKKIAEPGHVMVPHSIVIEKGPEPMPTVINTVDQGPTHNEMPNPTEKDLMNPVFNAIWGVIKNWDVNVPTHYHGYTGASGSHVMLILNGMREYFKANGLEVSIKKLKK
jgi:hypothetical protein